MSLARRTVEEYTQLLARAFNGAIEVDGQRIVAHPSGTLLAKPMRSAKPSVVPQGEVVWAAPAENDRETDWSDV